MTAETLATVLLWALLLMGGIYVIVDAVERP